jgi:hypothetical protein
MEKKNNHYIPRCLLKRWVKSNGKYDGVHVLNLHSKAIDFSSSSGKNAFSFASIDNLYILTQENNRQVNLENWFDGLENSLSIFIDKVSKSDSALFKNLGHLNKLVMSLVSFEFRSRYFFEKGIEFLDNNPLIKSGFKEKSSFQIVLENVVNATTDNTNLLFPVEFTIWKSDIPLLICDRPLMFKIVDDYSFFPLTPNLMLSFIKTKIQSTINYQNIDEKFALSFNNMIIENARDWIVSTDRNVLEELISRKDFGQYNDTVTFDKIKTLIQGYEY